MIGFYKKGPATQRYKKKALKDFSKAIKIDPEYLEAYYYRGVLGFSTDRLSGSSMIVEHVKILKKHLKIISSLLLNM